LESHPVDVLLGAQDSPVKCYDGTACELCYSCQLVQLLSEMCRKDGYSQTCYENRQIKIWEHSIRGINFI